MSHTHTHIILFIIAILLLVSCQQQNSHNPSVIFAHDEDTCEFLELDDIQQSGTIIAGTLSGPETYFQWHGRGWGLQFLMAEAFATSIGSRLQIQVARDSAQLHQWLEEGNIDFIALKPTKDAKATNAYWQTNTQSLADEIKRWWTPQRESEVMAMYTRKVQSGSRINRRPMWRNRQRGIISDYDHLFRRHAAQIGWDWRLMAAQCFQESGFDPNARSWAGAQGLMQIIPATAATLGIKPSDVYRPETNIAASAQYLKRLEAIFATVPDRAERTKFVLAAYNAGPGHIQDAQALALKYGNNSNNWNDVAQWVLRLQNARYYHDPAVKYGYMRGRETVDYVRAIHSHWNTYKSAS